MKRMKKIIATVILAALAVCAIASCGKKEIDATALATSLAKEGQFSEALDEVSENVAKKRYSLDEGDADVCISFKGTSAVVDEIAVIKSDDTAKVMDKMNKYKESQVKSYTSYMPSELPKLDDAIIEAFGDTVVYCVSDDADKAREIINNNVK